MIRTLFRAVAIYASALFVIFFAGCNSSGNRNIKEMNTNSPIRTYGADVAFFEKQSISFIELKDRDTDASVLIVPQFQGRVMTSSSQGKEGISYGWINYSFIESGVKNEQFNPYGGEERIWLGPEGGPFSIYFKPLEEQVFSNWNVPPAIDTEPFEIVAQNSDSVTFRRNIELLNASGTCLNVGVERKVKILHIEEVEKALEIEIGKKLSWLAYETQNTAQNTGAEAWTKESGAISIWMLSMFNTTDSSVVFIPFKAGNNDELGKIVTDDYFGKVPSDRLKVDEDILFFKTDGKKRSKIGISPERALPICGSYDPYNQHLTILWYSSLKGHADYVNSKWGPQENPFSGDVVNSYNDGPLEDGSIMGPFYEIESSSPAALLGTGEKITHTQRIFHIQGDEKMLTKITSSLFGLSIEEIKEAF